MKTVLDNYIRSQEVKDFSIHHQTISSLKLLTSQTDTMNNQTYKYPNGQTDIQYLELSRTCSELKEQTVQNRVQIYRLHIILINLPSIARTHMAVLPLYLFHYYKRSSRQSLDFKKHSAKNDLPNQNN